MKNPSKRRTERVECTIPIRWIRRSGCIELIAADCNLHGMFLCCASDSARPGELMHLEVSLPGGAMEMFVAARFVGTSAAGEGIGVEIFVIDDKPKTRLV